MVEKCDTVRRRTDQLRVMLGSITDPRAIEVIKREIETLENKMQQRQLSSHDKR
jgi:hypothetical protein